jgi:hypothetical protein
MIYEERYYRLRPGAVPIWFKLYEEKGLEVQKRILGNLVGYFMTEVGELNHIVHIWAYESMDDRARRRAELFADPQWLEFVAAVAEQGLIEKMDNRILVPAPFSPLQ